MFLYNANRDNTCITNIMSDTTIKCCYTFLYSVNSDNTFITNSMSDTTINVAICFYIASIVIIRLLLTVCLIPQLMLLYVSI